MAHRNPKHRSRFRVPERQRARAADSRRAEQSRRSSPDDEDLGGAQLRDKGRFAETQGGGGAVGWSDVSLPRMVMDIALVETAKEIG